MSKSPKELTIELVLKTVYFPKIGLLLDSLKLSHFNSLLIGMQDSTTCLCNSCTFLIMLCLLNRLASSSALKCGDYKLLKFVRLYILDEDWVIHKNNCTFLESCMLLGLHIMETSAKLHL